MFFFSLFPLIRYNTHSIIDVTLLPDFARISFRLLTFFPFDIEYNGEVLIVAIQMAQTDHYFSLFYTFEIVSLSFDRTLLFHICVLLVFLVCILLLQPPSFSFSLPVFLLSNSLTTLPLVLALALTFFLFLFLFFCSLLFQEDTRLFAAIWAAIVIVRSLIIGFAYHIRILRRYCYF